MPDQLVIQEIPFSVLKVLCLENISFFRIFFREEECGKGKFDAGLKTDSFFSEVCSEANELFNSRGGEEQTVSQKLPFFIQIFFKKTSLKSLCAKVHQVECASYETTLVGPHFFTSSLKANFKPRCVSGNFKKCPVRNNATFFLIQGCTRVSIRRIF